MTHVIGIISVRGEDYPPTRRFIAAGKVRGHRIAVIHPYRHWPMLRRHASELIPPLAGPLDAVMPRQGAEVGDGCLPLVRYFMDAGAVVINDLAAILLCRNQFAALQQLQSHGLPVPHTVFANDAAGVRAACDALPGEQVVVKAVSGRQGKDVVLMDRRSPEAAIVAGMLAPGRGVLIQEFIPPGGRRDIRVMVVGGRILGAMALSPCEGDFRANYHLTGQAEPVALSSDMADLALAAAGAMGLDVAGVDLVITRQGRPLLLEVNYSPGFQGLEAATGIDVAGAILDYTAGRIEENRMRHSTNP
jgi:ribosomal protein S6--L-glutamate ligase